MTKQSVALIRVAHLHSTTGIYGAERWTATQVQHLDKNIFSPLIITMGTKEGSALFHDFMEQRGFQVSHLPIPGKINPKAILALRRVLINQKINILHTHGFKSDVMGYFAARGLPIRLVATPHGWSADEGIRIRFYEAVSRFFLRRFDRIYPLSAPLLEDFHRRGFARGQLHLILNAVDISAFDRCFSSRKRRRLTDTFRILFAGRLCRPKGAFELLEAMARAHFYCPVELRLVGDGPQRQELESYALALGIGSKIYFTGSVSQIIPHLQWADVLVLPSHSEGIPRVIMEAFAAGVPVIGTAIPGIQELIQDDSTGRLTPIRNADALASVLGRAAVEPEQSWKMAIKARQVIMERFSAQRQALEFEREYAQLATETIPCQPVSAS
ncbi:MAG: glycosyltransferase [Pseudomonadota bacterium]